MPSLAADKTIEEFLGRASIPTEIRNAEGKLLGRFMPIDPATRALYDEARKLLDRNELKRRKDVNRGGYTFPEVMEHLKSLESAVRDGSSHVENSNA